MNPFSNNRNAMMHQQSYSAEPYREGMDYTDEAWAYGLRALPGSLANQLQALGEYTTGKDYPNKLGNYLNELTQVNEMGYTPQTEYEAGVAFLPELVYDPAIIAGAPYTAYKAARNAPRLLNVIADEAGRTGMRNQLGMITWQGSPHKYDGRLDPTKIGTGEGAQAYGYGHYLAESPDVAKTYREAYQFPKSNVLTGQTEYKVDGKLLPKNFYREADIAKTMQDGGIDPKTADGADWLESEIGAREMSGLDIDRDAVLDFFNGKITSKETTGNLYKFDLDDNAIANMLDWDAPLSEQPEAVRKALASIGIDNAVMPKRKHGAWFVSINGEILGKGMDSYDEALEAIERGWVYGRNDVKLAFSGSAVTGGDIYKAMLNQFGGANKASERLQKLGIPGIKYYDGSSRAAGEGTRNFVVFPGNENLVTPLERNGDPLGILPTR